MSEWKKKKNVDSIDLKMNQSNLWIWSERQRRLFLTPASLNQGYKCLFPLKINCTFFFLPPDEIWEGAKYSWNYRCRWSLSLSFSLSHHLITLIIAINVKWLIYLLVVLKSPMSSLALKGKSLRRRPHRQSKGPVGVKWSGTLSLLCVHCKISLLQKYTLQPS